MNFQIRCTALILSVYLYGNLAYFEREDNIGVMTDKNYKRILKNFNHVLMHFYAPWCTICKNLQTEFSYLANKLLNEKSSILPVKVDCIENNELKQKFNITEYPTVIMSVNKTLTYYQGKGTHDNLYHWSKEKTQVEFQRVSSLEEMVSFVNKYRLLLVFSQPKVDKNKRIKVLKQLVFNSNIPLVYSENKTIHKMLNLEEDKLYYFRRFEDMKEEYSGNWTPEDLNQFIIDKSYPLIGTDLIYDSRPNIGTYFILVVDTKEMDKTIENYTILKKVATDLHKKINFLILDIQEEDYKNLIQKFLRAKPGMYRILVKHKGRYLKYFPKKSLIEPEGIREFIGKFDKGELKPTLGTEKEPIDWDKGTVKVLVSETFDRRAKEENKLVFLLMYIPNDEKNRVFFNLWEQLGGIFKDSNDVIIAKMNGVDNEIIDFAPDYLPSLYFKPKGSKDFEEYVWSIHIKSLEKFVKSNGSLKEKFHKKPLNEEDDDDREEL